MSEIYGNSSTVIMQDQNEQDTNSKSSKGNIPRIQIIRGEKSKWDFLENTRRKTPKSDNVHRDGPAPKSEAKARKAGLRVQNGALDSDVEDSGDKNNTPAQSGSKFSMQRSTTAESLAGSKAFIIYFAKLAHAQDTELIDFDFVESLIQGGASVHSCDKHGQTVMHEVARNWHPDVAYFLLQKGADVNSKDKWGRTPLHSASAVDHPDMVEFLLKNGADIHAKTNGEMQTPIHYAAKFNAVRTLKVLIDANADVNDRDYKRRTPLFVAAETAREDAVRYLIERGAPAGVFDESGLSAVALMIEKMPKVAMEALDQFLIIDMAFRKEQYYLSYLEKEPTVWSKQSAARAKDDGKKIKFAKCPTSPLKVAVQCQELDILMHPVMQQLISTKWDLFGKWASIFAAGFHFVYIMIWTWLAIFLPSDGKTFYKPISKYWWRLCLELLGCLMTLYFIAKQIWEVKSKNKDETIYRIWRVRELERDIQYCHPRWPDEQEYLESEIERIQNANTSYFKDAWNIMDWLTYISVLTVIITRMLAVFDGEKSAGRLHPKSYAVALIFMWLHFMKSCRPFKSLGPFISMLGHVGQDTLRFAFLFFEFFIPYVCAFWIAMGSEVHSGIMEKAGQSSVDWKKFNDLTFSVWMVTLIANFNWNSLIAVDRLMAQVLVGSYFAIASVVCMNLYIALLSETFSRVYQNATANASLLQATTILQIEKALSKKRRIKAETYIQESCSPLELQHYSGHDGGDDSSYFSKLSHLISNRLDVLEDDLKDINKGDGGEPGGGRGLLASSPAKRTSKQEPESLVSEVMRRNDYLQSMHEDIHQIHEALYDLLAIPRPLPQPREMLRQMSEPRRFSDFSLSSQQSSGHASLREQPRSKSLPKGGLKQSGGRQQRGGPQQRGGRQQIRGIQQKPALAETIREEDFMRNILDQKLQGRNDLPNVDGKKKRRKRRSRNDREYQSDDGMLSNSWEDLRTEAESVF